MEVYDGTAKIIDLKFFGGREIGEELEINNLSNVWKKNKKIKKKTKN